MRRPWLRTVTTAIAGTLLVLGLARTAPASTTFPPIVKSHWNVSTLAKGDADGCTLCHRDDAGGFGTATRPFGKTMLRLHVIGATPDTLPKALDTDRSQALDSDGDKISDYQELVVDHTNPNDPKSFTLPPPPPPDGGEGGQSGGASSGGEGDQPSSPAPPPYTPPASDDLPPPFEHGCALAPDAAAGGFMPWLAVALAALAHKRRRGPGGLR